MTLQYSFTFYLRFNLRTFTTLLQVFYDDLRALLVNMDDQEVELAEKLTPIGRRILPSLRVYTNWLLLVVHLVQGMSGDADIGDSVAKFWPSYAKVIDLIAQAFPIWDLEDIDDVTYMLEEDVETIEFKPVTADNQGKRHKTLKTWMDKQTGKEKPKCTAQGVVRVSPDQEMLRRVKDLLADGLYLANDDDDVPIYLRGTRIYFGNEDNIDALVVRPVEYQPIAAPKVQEKPKVVSYAAAAANGHARQAHPPPQQMASANKTQSRDAQLSKMVDDLLDDDDGNNPVTPPQQHASNPAVVSNGDLPQLLQDTAIHDFQQPKGNAMKNVATRPSVTVTPPPARPAGNARSFAPQHERLQSVSKLWDNGQAPVSSLPTGLQSGTPLASPMMSVRGHSRGNSASSIRSRGSLNAAADPWASDSAPRTLPDSVIPQNVYGTYSSLDQSGMGSPLLFGAGGGPWSTGARPGFRNTSPPNGQGG